MAKRKYTTKNGRRKKGARTDWQKHVSQNFASARRKVIEDNPSLARKPLTKVKKSEIMKKTMGDSKKNI